MKMDLWLASWGGDTEENLFTTLFVNGLETYDLNVCFLIGCLVSTPVSGFNIHIPVSSLLIRKENYFIWLCNGLSFALLLFRFQ
jgi:hypothetical protein